MTVAEKFESLAPVGPVEVIGMGLNSMMVHGPAGESRGSSNLEGWVNVAASWVTYVTGCCSLEVKMTITDDADCV